MEPRLEQYLAAQRLDTHSVVPLTGDASDRSYFLVLLKDATPIVLALHHGAIDFDTMPFVAVARLLAEVPLPVPRILHHSNELGILGLEDLGDVTLQAHLGAAPAAEHAALYRQAVALIEELASEPRVLCHRDYHSRNLMLHSDTLYIIDFQDARMGPDTYDLASLLRDSYVDLPEQTVSELIAYFLALKGTTDQEVAFRERFDLMALQRNLKALGTFGYQTTARRNPVYIQYIPRTLRYVRDNLGRQPRFSRLRDVLAAHVEEFR